MSPRFTLNKQDLTKIAIGFLIALGGVTLTYIQTVLTQIDFGVYSGLVFALNSVAVNAIKKFLEGEKADLVTEQELSDITSTNP